MQRDDEEKTEAMCAAFSEGARADIARAAEVGDWGRALYMEGVLQGLQIVQGYLISEAEFIRQVERVFPAKRP